jgi:hypothetical protein
MPAPCLVILLTLMLFSIVSGVPVMNAGSPLEIPGIPIVDDCGCSDASTDSAGPVIAAGSASVPDKTITLTPNQGASASELVNLGIPLPPGLLFDPGRLRILDANGVEVPASVETALTWHFRDNSVRAVKVQFYADLRDGARQYRFDITAPRTRSFSRRPYDEGTMPGKYGTRRPRVVATLTPEWMTGSLLLGPQRARTAETVFDRYYEAQWNGWARDYNYTENAHEWAYDRVTTILQEYIRTGDPEYLDEACQSYRFYMAHVVTEGEPTYPYCAGGWACTSPESSINPCDTKYVLVKQVMLMLALAGDDSQHTNATVDLMARLCENGGWSYPITVPYTDPAQHFTERQYGLGLSSIVAAYEITGDPAARRTIDTILSVLYAHQQTNPDGFGFDGSWRHSWAMHEGDVYPGNVREDRGSSPWMSALVVGALWDAYRVTGDPRIPGMVRDYAWYLEEHGWIPESWFQEAGNPRTWMLDCNTNGTIAGYWSSSVAPVPALVEIQNSEGWASDVHNPDLRLTVAWAWALETDPARKATLGRRLDLIEDWFRTECSAKSAPPRMFAWQHRDSPAAQWFVEPLTDYPAPPAVTGLAQAGSSQNGTLAVTWKDPTSPHFDRVLVYRDGAFAGAITKGTQRYVLADLHAGETCDVGLRTVGPTGIESATWVNTTVGLSGDTTLPVVAFVATPTEGAAPLAVRFDDASLGTGITAYRWVFGDGPTVYSDRNLTHIFTRPGSYAVSHAATNGAGTAWKNETGVITVTAPPTPSPLPGFVNAPTDLDGDGKYEDVNGNGRKDFADVVLYFTQMTWIAENEPLSAFDYNGNGRIDFADVTWLFTHL